tara:strand:+ start:1427 stop:2305 length:879 start_codon:yes stop_codon:yes gene_type:complete
MRYIGISKHSDITYQGDKSHGYRLESPNLTPYYFVGKSFDVDEQQKEFDSKPTQIFVEDYFDPVTKIKRGRFYGNPHEFEWYIQDSTRKDLALAACRDGAAQRDRLITYQRSPLSELRNSLAYPDVVLGKEPFITIWKIVSIETSVFDVPIVTLKSHRSLGELPNIVKSNVPEDVHSSLVNALEKLESSVNRLGPTDVVDRCRDVLSIVFGTLSNDRTKDLGVSINNYVKALPKNQDNMVAWAARIVNRLHPRGKPNEQFKQGFREPSEQDAQLAVKCVWIVLIELGWGSSI